MAAGRSLDNQGKRIQQFRLAPPVVKYCHLLCKKVVINANKESRSGAQIACLLLSSALVNSLATWLITRNKISSCKPNEKLFRLLASFYDLPSGRIFFSSM